jgi:SAM-dependent methyltransferase
MSRILSRIRSISRIMDNTLAYRLWQAPFVDQKLMPIVRQNDLSRVRRVLDVGCGPGTNTRIFTHADYLGVDFNEEYIAYARARYKRTFMVADVTNFAVPDEERFDFILCNSLFHHIDTPDVSRLLGHLATLLSNDGHIHVIDLVLRDQISISRTVTLLDRGQWPRPVAEWRRLFSEVFEPVVFELFPVGAMRLRLWDMVYFKGRPRRVMTRA